MKLLKDGRIFIAWLLLTRAFDCGAATNAFEGDIRAFESLDRTNPPPKDAILFIGSSSIRLWKTLAKDLPEYPTINRGFVGSQIADSTYYAGRILVPYRPSVIVLYAGGNDINAGKSAETVFDDYKQFVRTVQAKLPHTHIAYISIAGNPARWAQVDRVREANRLIEQYAGANTNLSFVNVFPQMLGADGLPRPEIFGPDKLHMNAAGYELWTRLVREHLRKIRPR